MRSLFLGLALAGLLALPASADPQRIQSTFAGSAYNRVSNEYTEVATFVEIYPKKKGNDILAIEVDDRYWSETYKAYRPRVLLLEKNRASEYIAAIDKYAEWAEIATRDGDMITKEIAKVKAKVGKHRFQMHSGNASHHYLMIDLCPLICTGEEVLTFDYQNAMELRATLEEFRAGNLSVNPDLDSKYK